jgi:hypothetical protein
MLRSRRTHRTTTDTCMHCCALQKYGCSCTPQWVLASHCVWRAAAVTGCCSCREMLELLLLGPPVGAVGSRHAGCAQGSPAVPSDSS